MTAAPPSSPHVTWHAGQLTRERRFESLGIAGATVWFTGLPASGKSTVAAALEAELVAEGQPAYVLDGDNLRHGLNGDLGFSASDRAENVRRTAHVASLLAEAGTVALVSLVSPFESDRALARRIHEERGIRFVEVFVNVPLEICRARDPKGLYMRADAGEIRSFTGVSAPYEPPPAPDVELTVEDQPADAAARKVRAALRQGRDEP
jgi:adenylyl-sulfate kinase